MSSYLKNYKVIAKDDLPAVCAFGITFTAVTLNAPMHIRYLLQKLSQGYDIRVVRQKVSSLQSAFISRETSLVFNCTGNAARCLPGVEDPKCFPTRGQVILAKAGQISCSVMRHGRDYETYVIPRPGSNGNVILGGFMQKGVSTGDTFSEETESILERTKSMLADLDSPDTEVLAVFSGIRPSREGGARVSLEEIDISKTQQKGLVVQNYGAGGTGFQAGHGMATDAVMLAEGVLQNILSGHEKFRPLL
ncbi:D-amino-acid oxidase [Penicillium canariense]|uniref:D-amino-acid oxidase n=1 Tax=Penicillium canariense TaxID=189055 RepID=A0A9W9HZL7_9EURO|nr:D-amino-acid oxidase [Penicillium canariense]KAJ5160721.1 D-amino-acid oxidase [Penicillium canariense]